MIKNIVFDFGGVLIDDKSDDKELLARIQSLSPELQQKHKNTLHKSELGLIPYTELLLSHKEILFPEKTFEEIENYFFNTRVYEPFYIAENLLKKYNVIIFSNNHTGAPERVARQLNIDITKFPFINSAHVGMRKPDINFYKFLLEKYRLDPIESIFIDNTLANLLPAQQLGLQTFHYQKNHFELVKYLKQLGVEF